MIHVIYILKGHKGEVTTENIKDCSSNTEIGSKRLLGVLIWKIKLLLQLK